MHRYDDRADCNRAELRGGEFERDAIEPDDSKKERHADEKTQTHQLDRAHEREADLRSHKRSAPDNDAEQEKEICFQFRRSGTEPVRAMVRASECKLRD